jgi:hypothetical protein
VQLLDGPRNLHWGLYVLEEPRFLLDAEDSYARINGFPPEPSALAPAGKAVDRSGALHSWWGPLYPLVFASIWQLTGSYMALQLIIPLVAGGLIVITYLFGQTYFNQRVGLLAATLLALFPTFREHAVLALVEPFSALLLIGTIWAFLSHRTFLTILLATLSLLGKVDMLLLYFGAITLTALLSWRDATYPIPRRHLALCMGMPLLLIMPWFYLKYVYVGQATTVAGGPSLDIFYQLAPLIIDQFFTTSRSVTLPTLGILIILAIIGWSYRRTAPAPVYRIMGSWCALGWLVLLVYTAMPGASNNPRVLIPALPAFCLLIAAGVDHFRPRWKAILVASILTLFLIVNSISVMYQMIAGQSIAQAMPLYELLRREPNGYVLTNQYWYVALYARQPVTWFVGDEEFQRNILEDPDNFQRYATEHPIRYVIVPYDTALLESSLDTPMVRFYQRLPIGRSLDTTVSPLVSTEVRVYLETHYPQRLVGDYVIFYLDDKTIHSEQ